MMLPYCIVTSLVTVGNVTVCQLSITPSYSGHLINLTLVDQDNKKDDINHSFNPAELDTFSRPTNELDSLSGFTKFAPLSILDDPKYVKDDVMFIKVTVHMDTQHYVLV